MKFPLAITLSVMRAKALGKRRFFDEKKSMPVMTRFSSMAAKTRLFSMHNNLAVAARADRSISEQIMS
ncbi:hypothetical protein ACL2XP_07325 [Sodalis sp. RH21]|uniref:hypothetical protein n=1 Tax=unclassified Sodalis (in: enterobacteria) TaxID=2636512 RepID=UPI0039B53BB9